MSVLKSKVLWYGNRGSASAVEITDFERIDVRKGLDIKSNTVNIVLKNSSEERSSVTGELRHTWVDDTGKLIIQRDDVIEVYLKLVDDNTEIDITSTTDLLTTADVTEFKTVLTGDKSGITIGCIDKTFNLLNKLWTFAYTTSSNKSAPQIIQDIVRHVNEANEGGIRKGYETTPIGTTGSLVTDGLFEIDARLVSEGGYIQDTRPAPGSDSYPVLSIGKVFKAVYEWVEDVSQPESTNSQTELDNNNGPCPLKHIFYVDKLNRLHWEYPGADADYTIVVGDNSNQKVVSLNLKKSVFDVINTVYYNAGKDLDSAGVTGYYFNETTEESKLKIKYYPWTDIGRDLRESEREIGNISIGEDDTVTIDVSAGTTSWGTSYSTDADYKEKFRNQCDKQAKIRAERITKKRANPRWKGTITFKGFLFTAGELINLTARTNGISDENIRINTITHQVTKNNWSTILDIEQDDKALFE